MKNMTLELYVDESDDIQGYIDLAASLYLKGDDDVSEQVLSQESQKNPSVKESWIVDLLICWSEESEQTVERSGAKVESSDLEFGGERPRHRR